MKKYVFQLCILMIIFLIGQADLLYGESQESVKYVKKIQETLKKLGYDPGSADGLIGKGTKIAISAFEKKVGLAVTGKDSEKLRDYLFIYSTPVIREINSKLASDQCGYNFTFSAKPSLKVREDVSPSCVSSIRKHLAESLPTNPGYSLFTSKAGWREWDGQLNIF